jgi:hypothetical protein
VPTLDDLAAQLAALTVRVGVLEGKAAPAPAPTPAPAAGKPAKPTGLACAIGPDGRPDLRWDPATGVTAWIIRDEANPQPEQGTVTEPRSIRSALKAGQHRRYTVVAVGPGGRSDPSDAIDVPPASAPTPDPAPVPIPPSVRYPADICGKTWYLTLPTGKQGSPDTVHQPELARYASQYFNLTQAKDGIVFRTWHGGVTTSGSPNPRTELRECNPDGSLASWSCKAGHHAIAVTGQVNRLTKVRPHVVLCQVHGVKDDVSVARLEGDHLWVTRGNNDHAYLVDSAFRLGQRYSFGIVVDNGVISYTYNGDRLPFTQESVDPGSYFKSGLYLQSNPESARGESTDQFAEVVLYSVAVTHAT